MKNTKNPNVLYPILSALFAGVGTAALLLSYCFPRGMGLPIDREMILFLPLLWVAGLVAANVFLAAGIVLGTEVKTEKRKNLFAQFSEDVPEETETRTFRIPILSVLVALAAALLTGFFTESAVIGLLVAFTWGGLGFPLALCILNRTDFKDAMQTGLLTSVVLTVIGGVIQIFLRSPGNSFDPKHCFTWILNTLKDTFTDILTEAQALAQNQSLPGKQGEYLLQVIIDPNPAELAEAAAFSLLSLAPALFAIVVFALLCVIWWFTKNLLKTKSDFEVKYMGRLDGVRAGAAIPILYLLSYLINLFSAVGSPLKIASLNLCYVFSVILIFAGFSLVLYTINTHIPSRGMRVLLSLATALLGISSCGSGILLFLGIFFAGRDLRGFFGGGTLR